MCDLFDPVEASNTRSFKIDILFDSKLGQVRLGYPRGDRILRKWAYLSFAAAFAVVGCGGSGNGPSHTTTGGGGGTTKNVGIAVKLTTLSTPPPGAIEIAYLTGQGRA